MGYKLADGSDSSEYRIGDNFVVAINCLFGSRGDFLQLQGDCGDSDPSFFNLMNAREVRCPWRFLRPVNKSVGSGEGVGRKARMVSLTIGGKSIDGFKFDPEPIENKQSLELSITTGHDEAKIDAVVVNGVRFVKG